MLFNRKKNMISVLEAEIKSLRQKLRDAEMVIADQTAKIDELSATAVRKRGKSKKVQNAAEQEPSTAPANSDISVDDIAKMLYDFVCADKEARLDELISPSMILEPIKYENMDAVLIEIISGSRAKGALISNWKRKHKNAEAKPCLRDFLEIFFNFLSKHWWIASRANTDKSTLKYGRLKYNAHAYALLYQKILPQLVAEADREQRKREEEKRKRKQEMERKREEQQRKREEQQRKREEQQRKREEQQRKREEQQRKRKQEVERKRDEQQRKREEQERKRLAELKADWPLFVDKLDEELNKHSAAFIRNMRTAYQKDDYGAVVKDDRKAEVERFLTSVNLMRRAEKHGITNALSHILRWYAKKKRELEQAEAAPENGHDFEHWVAAQLNNAGWTASVTQASGDDGVDVIAERDGVSVAVQCKRFKGSVGNKAVQEVYSGMKHIQLDRAVVISTGQYTKAAKGLASTTGVLLLSEHDIGHLWDLLHK